VSKLAPDEASAAFKRVQQAYSVLGSAAERAAYDAEAGGRGSALDAAAAGRPATSHGPFAPLNSLEQWLSRSFRWLLLALAPLGVLLLIGLSTLKYEDPTRFDPDDETWVRAGRAVDSGRWVRFGGGGGAGLDSIGPNQPLLMVPRSWIGTLRPVEDLAPLRRRAASRPKSPK
jgi:curved DNA-binding protein CbpA